MIFSNGDSDLDYVHHGSYGMELGHVENSRV
jgi:hypothetical protein